MRSSATSTPWLQGLCTLLVWASVAASLAYWILTRPLSSPDGESAVAASAIVANTQGVQALLGARAAATPAVSAATPLASTRYALVGVLAGTQSGQGAALIAVDDQPARTYRVGSAVEGGDGYYLLSVQGRAASLGPSLQETAALSIELPEFAPSHSTSAMRPPSPTFVPAAPALQSNLLPQNAAPAEALFQPD